MISIDTFQQGRGKIDHQNIVLPKYWRLTLEIYLKI